MCACKTEGRVTLSDLDVVAQPWGMPVCTCKAHQPVAACRQHEKRHACCVPLPSFPLLYLPAVSASPGSPQECSPRLHLASPALPSILRSSSTPFLLSLPLPSRHHCFIASAAKTQPSLHPPSSCGTRALPVQTETANVQGASDEEEDGLTVLGDSPENTLRPPSPRLMSVTQPVKSPFANGGAVDLMVQASVEDPSKGDVVQQQGMVQQGMVQQQQGVAQPSRPASAVSSKASPSPLRPSSSQPEISEGAVEVAGEDVSEQLLSQPLPIPMHLHSLRVRRPSGAANPGSRPITPQAPSAPPPAAAQAAAAPSRPMTPITYPGPAPAPAPAQMEDILSDLVQVRGPGHPGVAGLPQGGGGLSLRFGQEFSPELAVSSAVGSIAPPLAPPIWKGFGPAASSSTEQCRTRACCWCAQGPQSSQGLARLCLCPHL